MKPTLLRYFSSVFYDSLLVIGLCFCVTAVILAVTNHYGSLINTYNSTFEKHLLQIALGAAIYGFFIYFWIKHQKTLGMQTWKIELVNSRFPNQAISFTQANIRFFIALISFSCFGLGIFWQYLDPQQRTWQDIASQTHLQLSQSE